MTLSERVALEARRDELAAVVAPFAGKRDTDAVMIAFADMFGSFRSMRQTGDDAVAVVEASTRSVRDFPRWVVEKVCLSMQQNGVWRDGKFDRQWPPNDPEIVDACRKELRLYGDQHRSAVALLAATVEEPR